MTNSLTKLLVPVAVISLFVGIVIAGVRSPAILIGLTILLLAWFVQKMTLETYQPQAVKDAETKRGELHFDSPSDLVVADNWSMADRLDLGGFEGNYGIEILKVRRRQAVFVDAIRLFRHGAVDGEARICTSTVSVDTGWLLFLNQQHATELLRKQYAEKTSAILISLPAEEPLILWVRSENGASVGVVVATGNGDGEYEIAYTTVDGFITELVVEFGLA